MVYTICIGSNERRKDNLALARKRLSELFPDIRFSAETDTQPLFFRRQALFANQVARFMSDCDVHEIILYLKSIEPVSYTHLDVYKRQVYNSAVFQCGHL